MVPEYLVNKPESSPKLLNLFRQIKKDLVGIIENNDESDAGG